MTETFPFFKIYDERFSLNTFVIVIIKQMPKNRMHQLQLNSIT